MASLDRPLAVVTGASVGIGYHLACIAAEKGHDLIVAADEARVGEVAADFEAKGARVHAALNVDLATREGVAALIDAIGGRPVAVLCANAGHGLGGAFLDQAPERWQHVINTNVTGTVDLLQQVGRAMRDAGAGRILITGSIAGLQPGAFQAVYNGTKAFIDSFGVALRNELKDTGVGVTVLMPGATETDFFERAGMAENTKVGTSEKQAAIEVAKTGWAAMESGDAEVVAGLKNKLMAMLSHIMPDTVLAEQHRKMAEPGSAA